MKIVITETQLKLLVESENMGSILIVGDSHTVDNGVTWSSLMKKNFDNVTVRAIGGKRTSWMKEQLTDALSKQHYDKVIIWGGSNDAFSLVSINNAVSNLQEMVNMVKAQNGTPYVIVGYDNRTFIDPEKMEPTRLADKEQMKKYREKMIQLQSEIGNKITGAVIIPMFGLSNSYTNDNIHGNVSAHRIVFDEVQKYIKQNPITKDLTNSEKENLLPDFLKNYKGGGLLSSLIGILGPLFGNFDGENLKPTLDNNVSVKNNFSCLKKSNPFPFPSNMGDKLKEIVGEEDYQNFVRGCESIGLPLETALRQLYTESIGFNKDVVSCKRDSPVGARGIAQFMTDSWKAWGEGPCTSTNTEGGCCDPKLALKAYVKFMGYLIKRFPGRLDIAVGGYNSGPNLKIYDKALADETPWAEINTKHQGVGRIPSETINYVSKILQC